MTGILISIIRLIANVLIFGVLIAVLMTYFVRPTHPARRISDVILDKMLGPIRRIVPSLSGIDFSPLIFVVIISILERVLIKLLA